ncbi:hypothetical protein M758_UG041500 [Ceratodon purpureus]|nr:hypothetical protein M758_UG041500 [Ceratodon purpureus]
MGSCLNRPHLSLAYCKQCHRPQMTRPNGCRELPYLWRYYYRCEHVAISSPPPLSPSMQPPLQFYPQGQMSLGAPLQCRRWRCRDREAHHANVLHSLHNPGVCEPPTCRPTHRARIPNTGVKGRVNPNIWLRKHKLFCLLGGSNWRRDHIGYSAEISKFRHQRIYACQKDAYSNYSTLPRVEILPPNMFSNGWMGVACSDTPIAHTTRTLNLTTIGIVRSC